MNYSMQQSEPRGLESFQHEVSKIADLGRYEDAYIAHVAEGETVVPMEVLDSNPRLKAMLFNQMLDMGINPERYIVGNNFNSINPVTGQPEFFLKKIFKGAKKALKDIAPYAGTIAAAFGAGPVYSALIGAGVPLLTGGDTGDVISGGLGGYGAGKAFGTSNFVQGLGLPGTDIESGIFASGEYGKFGQNLGLQSAEEKVAFDQMQADVMASDLDSVDKLAKLEANKKLYKKGIFDNPATALTIGSAFAPVIAEGLKPEDQDSIMDDPSFASLYPQNTYFGQYGNRIPDNYQMSFAADGGIMDLEYMDKYAMGGEFPRRQGQISGPGGPKDDLVPAMLSDGEFVMTAKAVDNAGGPRAMYNLMNRLDPDSSRGVGIA